MTLTGKERFFPSDRIIVSKTDLKGKITYANELFLSVSDYTEDEVIGQPHSMIRHPDMPRVVFKLLWDTVARGEELFAYVVNRTKHGDHYWVLAHVTPNLDPVSGAIIGYHSSRRCPERAAVERIKPLYARLRAIEAAPASRKDGLVESEAALAAHLRESGLRYDQFMYTLLRRAA